jgi:TldD protein
VEQFVFAEKITLLAEIDAYLRSKNSYVRQVSVSLMSDLQKIAIIRSQGQLFTDIRPLIRIQITIALEKNGRMEYGSYGLGGRKSYDDYIVDDSWKKYADEALRGAEINLESVAAPAGEMQVVLASGWPGILLHEAIGHGLEGDFNRKKTSAFSSLIGKRVAAKGVNVVDDGTIDGRRGSINIDDEGTISQKTILIEDGILQGYMQDRQNARLMGVKPTGNGRRENFTHPPMPRMTNTYMLPGNNNKNEIIESVKKGIYAVNFSGGQVDITSGKFVFSACEAYMIENGKITHPVKGATLIGNGPDVLTKISAIGNDLELDSGVGTCGKKGQSVPVGVGQPTLLINAMTVGGTEL